MYPLEFDKEIAKGTELEMSIYSNWLNATFPYPAELKQADEDQFYMYHGNLYFFSPYASKSIQHMVM